MFKLFAKIISRKKKVATYRQGRVNALQHLINFASECCLLITFANCLDPDQARQNVWPDLDTLMVFLKEFFEKVDFDKKNQQMTKKARGPPEKFAEIVKLVCSFYSLAPEGRGERKRTEISA